jgi:hypothetical protein
MQVCNVTDSRVLIVIHGWLLLPAGSLFSYPVCGALFCPSQTTCVNACHCSFNTLVIWVTIAWFAAVRLRSVQPTLAVVRNINQLCEFWKLSCISVRSSLLISPYMWEIYTWSAKCLVSNHFTRQTWHSRGQNTSSFCFEGALGRACLLPS